MGYYNQTYFDWQRKIGEFGGIANKFKFEPYIFPEDIVLDFGCGGGYLLKNLECRQKYGFDINISALQNAKAFGIKVISDLNNLSNGFFDKIISNHALEHTPDPLELLIELKEKLKDDGLAIFVVPHESPKQPYSANDSNMHLYTWTPQTLGNLFKTAGFFLVKSEVIIHQWPAEYEAVYEANGEKAFHRLCYQEALKNHSCQIRVIAAKSDMIIEKYSQTMEELSYVFREVDDNLVLRYQSLEKEYADLKETYNTLINSKSWKYTVALRSFHKLITRRKGVK